MSAAPKWWFTCDAGVCLYSQAAVERMARVRDPVRCIKHGALLHSDRAMDGLSRQAARKVMTS